MTDHPDTSAHPLAATNAALTACLGHVGGVALDPARIREYASIIREKGASKFKLKEMGSRYLFIILYLFIERYFSRGDYNK